MRVSTSLEPLPAARFGPAEARHLLRRAGFGPKPGEAEALAAKGRDEAVAEVVQYWRRAADELPRPQIDPDLKPYRTAEERDRLRRARRQDDQETIDRLTADFLARRDRDRAQLRTLQGWWIDRMIRTPRPLEEQLTLLWHDHFATRHRNVRDTLLMLEQNMMFREHACGNLVKLIYGIVRDPAMILFLDNDRNYARDPNENLARELLELFTLGEGNYSEQDVTETARALTGYHLDENRRFKFNHGQHDHGRKRILGVNDRHDGESVVDVLIRDPACPRFICYKLYNHFVADHTGQRLPAYQQNVIHQMAQEMMRHEYELEPVLTQLFRSVHFYEPALRGQKVKSPTQLLAGTARMLDTPMRDMDELIRAMERMGQVLFDPPSVAGWTGGRTWLNTSTLFARQNLTSYLICGQTRPNNEGIRHAGYDPERLVAEVDRTHAVVVDMLVDQLVGEHVEAARREPLVRYSKQQGPKVDAQGLAGLLMLITTMPEYQLC